MTAEPPSVDQITPAQLASTEQHMTAARYQADILLARTRELVATGVDLRNPARQRWFAGTVALEAIEGATVKGCGCAGSEGVAALTLGIELARRLTARQEDR